MNESVMLSAVAYAQSSPNTKNSEVLTAANVIQAVKLCTASLHTQTWQDKYS